MFLLFVNGFKKCTYVRTVDKQIWNNKAMHPFKLHSPFITSKIPSSVLSSIERQSIISTFKHGRQHCTKFYLPKPITQTVRFIFFSFPTRRNKNSFKSNLLHNARAKFMSEAGHCLTVNYFHLKNNRLPVLPRYRPLWLISPHRHTTLLN